MNKSKNIMEELELFITRGLREFPVCSIATETIENSAKYNKKKLSDEEVKQDCESKAFIRMASKLKKRFPRLPICIVADGLYVSEKVLKTCQNNRWDYIIRYKKGCAPSIEEEYESIPEKNSVGNAEKSLPTGTDIRFYETII